MRLSQLKVNGEFTAYTKNIDTHKHLVCEYPYEIVIGYFEDSSSYEDNKRELHSFLLSKLEEEACTIKNKIAMLKRQRLY